MWSDLDGYDATVKMGVPVLASYIFLAMFTPLVLFSFGFFAGVGYATLTKIDEQAANAWVEYGHQHTDFFDDMNDDEAFHYIVEERDRTEREANVLIELIVGLPDTVLCTNPNTTCSANGDIYVEQPWGDVIAVRVDYDAYGRVKSVQVDDDGNPFY